MLATPAQTPPPGGLQQHHITLLRIYAGYRLLLSVALLMMLISPTTRELVGHLNPRFYLAGALIYLLSGVLLLLGVMRHWPFSQRGLFAVFLVDIASIVLLADTSGGMGSGLPILLVITVAAGAVMLSRRILATLLAAISVLATLADTVWLILRGAVDINGLLPAGLLGLLIFGVSLLVQLVAYRLGRAEALARSRASDLEQLQRLNEQIVRHLQAGVLLVDEQDQVRRINKAAHLLLPGGGANNPSQPEALASVSPALAGRFSHWRLTGNHLPEPFQASEDSPLVTAHFLQLGPDGIASALIFLEDYGPVTQHAQSLKLASLGRLTASIAHEIRNPLGAISHAAQLLQESPDLNRADQRLADIIQQHSVRVNQTIESIMQISRREPPRPELLQLSTWVADFLEHYQACLQEPAEIEFQCRPETLTIEFDPENLRRVLSNLLDNALRHSKMATGRATARVLIQLDPVTEQCLLDVIDLGSGVSPRDQSKLFEPFFTTIAEGSGMGLYLSRELCEINRAGLHYRLTDAGESCFRISLSPRGFR